MRIAIDGPAGAGKSTIAKEAARRLGMVYVDTGAMYRGIGVYALRQGVDPKDASGVTELLPEIRLTLCYEDGTQHILLNGEDLSDAIRTPEASMASSSVSAHPAVRAFLLDYQRSLGRRQSVVMDGRDIGTVVFPDAECKIFMTASDEVRARRRYDELAAKGTPAPFEEVLADLRRRDYNDSHRAVAPLRPAEDAVILDTSDLDLESSVEEVLRIVREKL